MTFQDLGSLGELIAAVATVATLIYLAFQIRQNTLALSHAANRAVVEDANTWRANLIQNPEVAELYRKGLLDPDALDPIEKLRFRMLLGALFSTWLYVFQTGRDWGESSERYIRGMLAQPGGAQYWAHQKSSLDALFVEWVDGLARKDDRDG